MTTRACCMEAPRLPQPNEDDVAIDLAERHRARGDVADAIAAYTQVLHRAPHRVRALLALGAIHITAGAPHSAEPLLARCCAFAPDNADAHHAWGLSLLLLENPGAAFDVLATAQNLDPNNALCAVNLADAAHAADRTAEGAAILTRSRHENPANAAALTGHAALCAHAGDREQAIDALEAATLLDASCHVAAAMFADMLARTTRQGQAEAALRHAMVLDPNNYDAAMALSVVLLRLHRYTQALGLLQSLLDAAKIDRVGPLCNMVTTLVALGRVDDAVAAAQEAIALAPSHPAPRRALCNALPYQTGVTGAALLDAARACAARQPIVALPPLHADRNPHRKLRLGLLSGTFRNHPVGWLTIAGFEQLDPAQYDLICLTPNQPEDPIGRRFAAIAFWEDTGSLDDKALAERIRAEKIDILIDLGGYGDFGRLPTCAYRAAPVQIKWVGMQNHSTGLPTMDWFISDRWETPPGAAAAYSENLLILRDGYVCYAPPPDAPDVAPLPAVSRGHITFGCYNNLAKITPHVIETWSAILHRVPNARLVLKSHPFNDPDCSAEICAAFSVHDIAPDRLSLRGSSPHRALLAQYADIDVVLDPFPYSGGLTTCEALWMGVPTLTTPGDTFASRHSTSHMSNVGMPDWVVPDIASYIDAAVTRAGDLPALAALRSALRDRVRRSPLCDAQKFGASLDIALRHAWHEWCRTAPDLHPSL